MSVAEDKMFQTALDWLASGRSVALATVINTWGSSPRPEGSMLVIDSDGNFEGSVSGGCVETDVITSAQSCIRDGKTMTSNYRVSNERAWEVGLACGGAMDIFIEPVRHDSADGLSADKLRALAMSQSGQGSLVLIKTLDTGHNRLWRQQDETEEGNELDTACTRALSTDRCERLELEGDPLFLLPANPPLRMIIVGAVHIAQKLVVLAQACGYHVIIVDPRQSFASEERFPGVEICTDWPDKAMRDLAPDHRTAVVTLTHDPKLDEPALEVALASPAFYIGSLGSRKTHAARVDRLKQRGLTDQALGRIHAPVGLSIGARSAAEIAVSILAQLTEALRKPAQTG